MPYNTTAHISKLFKTLLIYNYKLLYRSYRDRLKYCYSFCYKSDYSETQLNTSLHKCY